MNARDRRLAEAQREIAILKNALEHVIDRLRRQPPPTTTMDAHERTLHYAHESGAAQAVAELALEGNWAVRPLRSFETKPEASSTPATGSGVPK